MERHAMTFAVRQGTEQEARQILSSYPRPETDIDGDARLLGTTVFFCREQVVRVMDVEGPLLTVMRHLATQPAIRATEAALNPLLAHERDLSDPSAARAFFVRAMMRRAVHRVTDSELLASSAGTSRHRIALRYPVRPGHGDKVAAVLASGRPLAVGTRERTVLANTTVFHQGDLVIRIADVVGSIEAACDHLGRTVIGAPTTEQLDGLLEPGWDLGTESGFRQFFAEQQLTLVTDRRAHEPVDS